MDDPDHAESTPNHGALTDADMETIRLGASTLPGQWYLDPLIDRRRARSRAWIRADEPSDHRVDAIGLERSVGLVLVTVCQDGEDEHAALPNMVFETLEGAFSSLRLYLDCRVSKDRRTRRKG